MELEQFVTAVGTSITNSQQAIERRALDNYFDYFHSQGDGKESSLFPDIMQINIPKSDMSNKYWLLQVPLVALSLHNSINLDEVRVQVGVCKLFDEDNKVQMDLSKPCGSGEESPYCELDKKEVIELLFKRNQPSEGISRINVEMNKVL